MVEVEGRRRKKREKGQVKEKKYLSRSTFFWNCAVLKVLRCLYVFDLAFLVAD